MSFVTVIYHAPTAKGFVTGDITDEKYKMPCFVTVEGVNIGIAIGDMFCNGEWAQELHVCFVTGVIA